MLFILKRIQALDDNNKKKSFVFSAVPSPRNHF